MKVRIKNFLKERKKIVNTYILSIIIRGMIAFFFIIYLPNIISSNSIWNELLMNNIESYADYKYYYQGFASEFVNGHWIPYRSCVHFKHNEFPYVYPPFFLYVISLPALISVDLVFLPLFLADILLPIVIYKFLIKSQGQKIAEWGFLASAFCPLSIFYNGVLFLNTSLVTLFFIISLYFISINKFKTSIVMLGITILFKQTIILFVLPIELYIIFQSTEDKTSIIAYFKKAILYFGILSIVVILGSLPWIILFPEEYIRANAAGGGTSLTPKFVPIGMTWPVSWYSFLINWGAPYWLLYIISFLNFTFIGIIFTEILSLFLLQRWYLKKNLNWTKLLDLIVLIAFLTHLFFPRGVYKYYFTLHVPLVILWICFHFGETMKEKSSQRKKIFLIFVSVSLIMLITPRLYYLLIIWILFFVWSKKTLRMYKTISPIDSTNKSIIENLNQI